MLAYIGCSAMALGLGLIVSYLTGLTKGHPRAHDLPGVALCAGAISGMGIGLAATNDVGILFVLIGGLCGLGGWLLYRKFTPLR